MYYLDPFIEKIADCVERHRLDTGCYARWLWDRNGKNRNLGRTVLAYPDFAKDILKKGSMDFRKQCICCSKCTELMRAGSTPGCVVQDRDTYLTLYQFIKRRKNNV